LPLPVAGKIHEARYKRFSGKFILRMSPDTHEAAALAAQACGKSLNQWVSMLIEQSRTCLTAAADPWQALQELSSMMKKV